MNLEEDVIRIMNEMLEVHFDSKTGDHSWVGNIDSTAKTIVDLVEGRVEVKKK